LRYAESELLLDAELELLDHESRRFLAAADETEDTELELLELRLRDLDPDILRLIGTLSNLPPAAGALSKGSSFGGAILTAQNRVLDHNQDKIVLKTN
jgi:hypothetical protein